MKRLLLALLCLVGPAGAQEAIPFHYAGGHFICVNVTVADTHPTEFIFDTGIGVNLVSNALARQLGCPVTGIKFTGQRMSGQSVDVPLTWLKSLTVAGQRQSFVTSGTWEFDKDFLPTTPDFARVEGFLGLRFFQHQPVTLDYGRKLMILETPSSLAARVERGVSIPILLDDDQGVSLTAFTWLDVEGGPPACVEIDTGSHSSELHVRYMATLGIPAEGARVQRGTDETQHEYVRYFAVNPRSIALGRFAQKGVTMMFQDIIHDGLIGNDFLSRYTVTYDLSRSRIILADR